MLPDLVTIVLSFLHDDYPSLRASALIHRSWTPVAQAILFDVVDVHASSVERRAGHSTYYSTWPLIDILRRAHPSYPRAI
jgi:hypothetical protein